MNNYIQSHKENLNVSKLNQEKFRNFCIGLYETQSLNIEPAEKAEFERLRVEENNDYEFRKKIFWPCYAFGLLLFDQIITMPASKSNKPRILYNTVLGIPFVGITCTGLIFYREKVASHEYALKLCEKYKACEIKTDSSNTQ